MTGAVIVTSPHAIQRWRERVAPDFPAQATEQITRIVRDGSTVRQFGSLRVGPDTYVHTHESHPGVAVVVRHSVLGGVQRLHALTVLTDALIDKGRP